MSSPGSRRVPATWWRETVVIAMVFASCLLGGAARADGTLSSPPPVAYVLAGVSCAVLPMRHRAPLAALVATTVGGVLVQPLGMLLNLFNVAPVMVTAYSYALRTRSERRVRYGISLSCAALLLASATSLAAPSWQDVTRMATVAAFPLLTGVLGHSVQNRRAYLAAVEERAWRAEQSRESEARRRVAEERVRIARELHDLVAHQITLANAQAMVADHLFDTDPQQTRKSLTDLVRTTRDALDDLRATVGLLRQTGDAAASVEPAPGLSRLASLLDSFARAGLRVSVAQQGQPRPLALGVDLTAYRIVQEALTNVSKHAGTASAEVRLDWGHDHLTLTVTNRDPDGGRAAVTGPVREPGYGLIGMQERATAAGGNLVARERPEGGFLVQAHLPLPQPKEMS